MSHIDIKLNNKFIKTIACKVYAEAGLLKKLNIHSKRRDKLLKNIVSATSDKQRKNKTKLFFNSYSSCLCAIVESASTRSYYYTMEEFEAAAKQISTSRSFFEPIRVTHNKKDNGGFRFTCSSGLKRKAIQIMVRDLLETLEIGFKKDFCIQGGRDKAINQVKQLTNKNNYPWVVIGDITDFYGSVQHGAVRELLQFLPKDVIDNCVFNHKKLKLNYNALSLSDNDISQLKRKVRQGLPQGSPCSSRIASALYGTLLEEVANQDRIVLHGDDFCIGASTSCEAEAIKQALFDRCKTHPAGPFRLKFLDVYSVAQSYSYLGYRIKYSTQVMPDSTVARFAMASPTTKAFNKFFKKLEEKMSQANDDEFFNVGWRYARMWIVAHKSWEIPQVPDSNETIDWILPPCGIQNFVLQIEMAINDESQKRGYPKALGWVSDFNIRVMKAKHLKNLS